MNNNLPMVNNKANIYERIKSFIKKIFSYNNIEENYSEGKKEIMINKNFKEEIKIQDNELLKLQEKFEKGLITEEELTEEESAKLEELYNSQIKMLRDKFEMYKKKIITIKKELSTNNN